MRSWFFIIFIGIAGCGEGAADLSKVGESGKATPSEIKIPLSEKQQSRLKQTPGSTNVQLRLNEPVLRDDLSIKWIYINDSRCPMDKTCFWQGQVTISLEMTYSDGVLEVVELLLREGTENIIITDHGKTLKLLSVQPYPVSGSIVPLAKLLAIVDLSVI